MVWSGVSFNLILSKGQSSSRLLQPVCCQIGALQLPTGSGERPADAASRAYCRGGG